METGLGMRMETGLGMRMKNWVGNEKTVKYMFSLSSTLPMSGSTTLDTHFCHAHFCHTLCRYFWFRWSVVFMKCWLWVWVTSMWPPRYERYSWHVQSCQIWLWPTVEINNIEAFINTCSVVAWLCRRLWGLLVVGWHSGACRSTAAHTSHPWVQYPVTAGSSLSFIFASQKQKNVF